MEAFTNCRYEKFILNKYALVFGFIKIVIVFPFLNDVCSLSQFLLLPLKWFSYYNIPTRPFTENASSLSLRNVTAVTFLLNVQD